MEIETKSARLDTLAVTIQALHVSGKQMTLAVFRQLPQAHAYNDDGSMAPMEPWGIVRYSIKDEGETWVVCASEGRLYRCRLYCGTTVEAAAKQVENAQKDVAWWKSHLAAKDAAEYAWRTVPFAPCNGRQWREGGLPELENELLASEHFLAICKRRARTREALAALPQLFIAV